MSTIETQSSSSHALPSAGETDSDLVLKFIIPWRGPDPDSARERRVYEVAADHELLEELQNDHTAAVRILQQELDRPAKSIGDIKAFGSSLYAIDVCATDIADVLVSPDFLDVLWRIVGDPFRYDIVDEYRAPARAPFLVVSGLPFVHSA